MLFFGHLGITLGVVRAYDALVSASGSGNKHQPASDLKLTGDKELPRPYHSLARMKARLGVIDYRLVLLGSLLPDIIDKSAWFLLSSYFSLSGRDYAHSLLFNLVLLIGGWALLRSRKSWLLMLSVSSLMHLIFDQIWRSPEVLLWPLLGPLRKGETTGWLANIFQGLFLYPEVYVPEIIGLVITLLLAYRLLKRRGVLSFLRSGVIS